MKNLILFLCLFVVYPAHAERPLAFHRKVGINFYCVPSEFGLTFEQCKLMIRDARRRLRKDVRILLLIKKIKILEEPFPHLVDSPDKGLPYLRELQKYFSGLNPRRIQYVVAQPFIDADLNRWILGYSTDVCTRGRTEKPFNREFYPPPAISFSTAVNFSVRNEDRYNHSLVALMHEIGHAIGAGHHENMQTLDPSTGLNSAPNIMQIDALRYVKEYGVLPFAQISKVEIFFCAKGDTF